MKSCKICINTRILPPEKRFLLTGLADEWEADSSTPGAAFPCKASVLYRVAEM